MKSYTKVYLKYFGYTTADYIPCEVSGCGKKAVDLHHVEARSKRMDLLDDIHNLMAICRTCHEKYGDKKQYKDFLKETHLKKMQQV